MMMSFYNCVMQVAGLPALLLKKTKANCRCLCLNGVILLLRHHKVKTIFLWQTAKLLFFQGFFPYPAVPRSYASGAFSSGSFQLTILRKGAETLSE